MGRYAVTAWSAANAVGTSVADLLDGLCRGTNEVRVRPDFAHPVAAMSLPGSEGAARRALRVAGAAFGDVLARISAASSRWGASRIGLVVAASSRDDDLRKMAVRAGAPVPASTPACLVDDLGARAAIRGPAYAVVDDPDGARAWRAARALLTGDFADAVVVAGVAVLGRAAAAGSGEGAAFVVLERTGDAWVELVDVSSSSAQGWSDDVAYVDAGASGGERHWRACTGALDGADLPTALSIAAEALSQGRHPLEGSELSGDHVVVRRGAVEIVLRARLS